MYVWHITISTLMSPLCYAELLIGNFSVLCAVLIALCDLVWCLRYCVVFLSVLGVRLCFGGGSVVCCVAILEWGWLGSSYVWVVGYFRRVSKILLAGIVCSSFRWLFFVYSLYM
jgi:hypothetical protein